MAHILAPSRVVLLLLACISASTASPTSSASLTTPSNTSASTSAVDPTVVPTTASTEDPLTLPDVDAKKTTVDSEKQEGQVWDMLVEESRSLMSAILPPKMAARTHDVLWSRPLHSKAVKEQRIPKYAVIALQGPPMVQTNDHKLVDAGMLPSIAGQFGQKANSLDDPRKRETKGRMRPVASKVNMEGSRRPQMEEESMPNKIEESPAPGEGIGSTVGTPQTTKPTGQQDRFSKNFRQQDLYDEFGNSPFGGEAAPSSPYFGRPPPGDESAPAQDDIMSGFSSFPLTARVPFAQSLSKNQPTKPAPSRRPSTEISHQGDLFAPPTFPDFSFDSLKIREDGPTKTRFPHPSPDTASIFDTSNFPNFPKFSFPETTGVPAPSGTTGPFVSFRGFDKNEYTQQEPLQQRTPATDISQDKSFMNTFMKNDFRQGTSSQPTVSPIALPSPPRTTYPPPAAVSKFGQYADPEHVSSPSFPSNNNNYADAVESFAPKPFVYFGSPEANNNYQPLRESVTPAPTAPEPPTESFKEYQNNGEFVEPMNAEVPSVFSSPPEPVTESSTIPLVPKELVTEHTGGLPLNPVSGVKTDEVPTEPVITTTSAVFDNFPENGQYPDGVTLGSFPEFPDIPREVGYETEAGVAPPAPAQAPVVLRPEQEEIYRPERPQPLSEAMPTAVSASEEHIQETPGYQFVAPTGFPEPDLTFSPEDRFYQRLQADPTFQPPTAPNLEFQMETAESPEFPDVQLVNNEKDFGGFSELEALEEATGVDDENVFSDEEHLNDRRAIRYGYDGAPYQHPHTVTYNHFSKNPGKDDTFMNTFFKNDFTRTTSVRPTASPITLGSTSPPQVYPYPRGPPTPYPYRSHHPGASLVRHTTTYRPAVFVNAGPLVMTKEVGGQGMIMSDPKPDVTKGPAYFPHSGSIPGYITRPTPPRQYRPRPVSPTSIVESFKFEKTTPRTEPSAGSGGYTSSPEEFTTTTPAFSRVPETHRGRPTNAYLPEVGETHAVTEPVYVPTTEAPFSVRPSTYYTTQADLETTTTAYPRRSTRKPYTFPPFRRRKPTTVSSDDEEISAQLSFEFGAKIPKGKGSSVNKKRKPGKGRRTTTAAPAVPRRRTKTTPAPAIARRTTTPSPVVARRTTTAAPVIARRTTTTSAPVVARRTTTPAVPVTEVPPNMEFHRNEQTVRGPFQSLPSPGPVFDPAVEQEIQRVTEFEPAIRDVTRTEPESETQAAEPVRMPPMPPMPELPRPEEDPQAEIPIITATDLRPVGMSEQQEVEPEVTSVPQPDFMFDMNAGFVAPEQSPEMGGESGEVVAVTAEDIREVLPGSTTPEFVDEIVVTPSDEMVGMLPASVDDAERTNMDGMRQETEEDMMQSHMDGMALGPAREEMQEIIGGMPPKADDDGMRETIFGMTASSRPMEGDSMNGFTSSPDSINGPIEMEPMGSDSEFGDHQQSMFDMNQDTLREGTRAQIEEESQQDLGTDQPQSFNGNEASFGTDNMDMSVASFDGSQFQNGMPMPVTSEDGINSGVSEGMSDSSEGVSGSPTFFSAPGMQTGGAPEQFPTGSDDVSQFVERPGVFDGPESPDQSVNMETTMVGPSVESFDESFAPGVGEILEDSNFPPEMTGQPQLILEENTDEPETFSEPEMNLEDDSTENGIEVASVTFVPDEGLREFESVDNNVGVLLSETSEDVDDLSEILRSELETNEGTERIVLEETGNRGGFNAISTLPIGELEGGFDEGVEQEPEQEVPPAEILPGILEENPLDMVPVRGLDQNQGREPFEATPEATPVMSHQDSGVPEMEMGVGGPQEQPAEDAMREDRKDGTDLGDEAMNKNLEEGELIRPFMIDDEQMSAEMMQEQPPMRQEDPAMVVQAVMQEDDMEPSTEDSMESDARFGTPEGIMVSGDPMTGGHMLTDGDMVADEHMMSEGPMLGDRTEGPMMPNDVMQGDRMSEHMNSEGPMTEETISFGPMPAEEDLLTNDFNMKHGNQQETALEGEMTHPSVSGTTPDPTMMGVKELPDALLSPEDMMTLHESLKQAVMPNMASEKSEEHSPDPAPEGFGPPHLESVVEETETLIGESPEGFVPQGTGEEDRPMFSDISRVPASPEVEEPVMEDEITSRPEMLFTPELIEGLDEVEDADEEDGAPFDDMHQTEGEEDATNDGASFTNPAQAEFPSDTEIPSDHEVSSPNQPEMLMVDNKDPQMMDEHQSMIREEPVEGSEGFQQDPQQITPTGFGPPRTEDTEMGVAPSMDALVTSQGAAENVDDPAMKQELEATRSSDSEMLASAGAPSEERTPEM